MVFRKLMRMVLPISAVAAGILLFPGTASAETADIPIATGVTSITVSEEETPAIVGVDAATNITQTESGWIDTNDGRKYLFEDGYFAIGQKEIDGILYLFDRGGFQQTGWQTINGARHYYDPNTGAAASGVQKINGTEYLFDYTGIQKTGWQTINGVRCYYDTKTGNLVSGWIDSCGYRYYSDAKTGKQTGEVMVQNKRYLLDSTYGYQKLGFCTFSDKTVSYYQNDGSIVSGWLKVNGNSYYFDSTYRMKTDWQTISGKKYYFASDGAMQTGFKTIGGKTYYFSSNGTMQTGWQTISESKYYFGSDGVMLTGKQKIDGKNYTFTSDGKLQVVRICLDAGHYGKYNRSPVNGTYYESDMSWKLHLYLKAELEAYGIEVITTRKNQETDLALEARGKTAVNCDLFLSLHSNACNSSSIDAPLACCCVDGTMDKLGQLLADTVHQVMGTSQGGTIWKRVGLSGDYYGVLRGAAKVGVSGILLEHSYHTNLAATNWLLVDSNLERMAKAEAAVIAAYFGLT